MVSANYKSVNCPFLSNLFTYLFFGHHLLQRHCYDVDVLYLNTSQMCSAAKQRTRKTDLLKSSLHFAQLMKLKCALKSYKSFGTCEQ